MADKTIRIITTGGTFDKHYDAVKGELTFRESHLPRILNQSRVTLPIHLDALFAVDSLVLPLGIFSFPLQDFSIPLILHYSFDGVFFSQYSCTVLISQTKPLVNAPSKNMATYQY